MTLFEGEIVTKTTERERETERVRQTEREREGEKKKERNKERKRASSMPNDMVTAGNRAPQVVNVHNSICFVYAKFN